MNKAQALKLVEVTSQRQADNGTVCYHDPIANCDYMSYESGYVRRKYSQRNWRGLIINTVYQLNKTKMSNIAYKDYYGNLRVAETKQRILVPNHEDRMEIIYRAVINYRKTLKKYQANKQLAHA